MRTVISRFGGRVVQWSGGEISRSVQIESSLSFESHHNDYPQLLYSLNMKWIHYFWNMFIHIHEFPFWGLAIFFEFIEYEMNLQWIRTYIPENCKFSRIMNMKWICDEFVNAKWIYDELKLRKRNKTINIEYFSRMNWFWKFCRFDIPRAAAFSSTRRCRGRPGQVT